MWLWRETGRRGTAPAAIPPSLSAGVGEFFSAPFTGFFYMGLIHSQEVAEAAAITLAEWFSLQGRSTEITFFSRQLLRRIRLVILFPPFDSTGVAAKFSLLSRAPFRLKILSAIWTHLLRLRPLSPIFQCFLSMVRDPALIAAKPPPAPWLAFFLLHNVSAGRADIDRHFIMPLGVVVPMPTGVAAELLTADVTGWRKFFPAI
jgi:hypothetical protein